MTPDARLSRSLSVVVPVYNSTASLEKLADRLEPVLAAEARVFELILVDDGSQPDTWETIERITASKPWARGLRLMRNYGQHNALLCGIREARHDWIVTLDDDLQHPPEEIPRLLAALDQGFDVVYGTPQEDRHDYWRNLASQFTKLVLATTMGAETARWVSAFRVFRAQLRDAFAEAHGPYVSIDVLLTWGTARFGSVQVRHDPREIGASQYSVRRLVTHAFNMLTGFSVLPLQLATWTGFALTLFGMGTLVFVVGRILLQGAAVPGFAFLASLIAIFAGAQLFSLGIIGAYLARMHFRSMRRPAYAVRERTRGPDPA